MSYDPVSLGTQWDRLVSIADEMITSLVRTAFSTNVRESYDLSCIVFDRLGRAIAQGSYSVPSFTGTASPTLAQMLARFPAETLRPGDVVITNDPWIGTGHVLDVSVMQPVFRGGRIVGFIMSVTHLPDVGGVGYSAIAREIYEEGFRIPPMLFVRDGRPDPLLLELLQVNVRVPEQTIGDILANVTCTTVGARTINEFLDEYGIEDLTPLADAILNLSERAIREEIDRIPKGTYENRISVEGYETPLSLACRIVFDDAGVTADFSGSSPADPSGINVPICYTRAMACHAIKCLTTPLIPNNEGSVRPIRVVAPPGCILNALPPSATGGRHIIGHFVQPLVFGALAPVVRERVQADSGMLNLIYFHGRNREEEEVSNIFFAAGGFGALHGIDGLSTLPSPSNMTGTPIEVWENLTGMFVLAKELLPDSGGAGKYRGGLGQRIVLRNDSGHPMTISCLAGRSEFAPAGVFGGKPGALRRIEINGRPVHTKGRYILAAGDVLVTYEAGAGGYGDPRERDKHALRTDVRDGYVSLESAERDYGGLGASGMAE